MQSSDSCAQSQGLELARQTGRGVAVQLALSRKATGGERGEVEVGGWLVGRAGGGGGAQADEGGKQQGLSEMVVGEVKEEEEKIQR